MADALSPAFRAQKQDYTGLHMVTLPGYPDVCFLHMDPEVALGRAADHVRSTFPEASWNYRAVLHDEDPDPEHHWIGIHEVHYRHGTICSWTMDAVGISAGADEGVSALVDMLERATKGARDKPLLRLSELWLAVQDRDANGQETGGSEPDRDVER